MTRTATHYVCKLAELGYPEAAAALESCGASAVPGILADIAASAQHDATPREIRAATRLVRAIASRFPTDPNTRGYIVGRWGNTRYVCPLCKPARFDARESNTIYTCDPINFACCEDCDAPVRPYVGVTPH